MKLYKKAGENLMIFKKRKVFIEDEERAFYLYLQKLMGNVVKPRYKLKHVCILTDIEANNKWKKNKNI